MHRNKGLSLVGLLAVIPTIVLLLSLLVGGIFALLATAADQSVASTTRELTKAEAEFVQICIEMDAAVTDYYARADELKDDAERAKFRAENDPYARYVPKLIEVERSHHGTHAGLMAARKLVLLAASGGRPGSAKYLGRRHALTVLNEYADAPELPAIMSSLPYGLPEPETEAFLRKLMDAPDAGDRNRAFAKLTFARWALTMRDISEGFGRDLKELDESDAPSDPKKREGILLWLSPAPPPERIAGLEREAVELLESLCDSGHDLRMPGVAGVVNNHQRYVIDIDPEKTKSMPSLKDFAAGVLFKEQHLRVGRPAPELTLQLISGKEWSLAEQRDKVVVIQFSFKGCGPCEAMYPDLRALTAEYGEKLVILSVMADEKRQDTIGAVESGKLTWNVYWDGSKGPMATQWGVIGYPTVYVVGPDGRIAGDTTQYLRDEPLRTKIAELMR